MKTIIFAVLAFLLVSCSFEPKIGQYVYLDAFCTVHIDRDCKMLTDLPKDTKEYIGVRHGVTFVDTCNLNYDSGSTESFQRKLKFCPNCINDETYKQLLTIIENHEKKL
jgi:hypothetical protein